MTEEEKEIVKKEIKELAPDMPQEVEAYMENVNLPQQYDNLRTVLSQQSGEPIKYSYNERGVNIVNGSSRWQHSQNSYLFENGNTGERASVQYNPHTGEARGDGTLSDGEKMDFYMDAQGRFSARVDDREGMRLDMDGRMAGSEIHARGRLTIQDENGDVEYSATGKLKIKGNDISLKGKSIDEPGSEDQSVSTLDLNVRNGVGTLRTSESEDGVTTVETQTGQIDPSLLMVINNRSR